MASPPPPQRRYRTIRKEKETHKWWNEYPLEGDPKRPAVWLTNVLSKSPRLIGWDDERMERRALEALPEQDDDEEDITEIHIGPKREVVDQVAFGLLGIATREVTKHLLHLEERTDTGLPVQKESDSEDSTIWADKSEGGEKVEQRDDLPAEDITPSAAAFAQFSGEDAATLRETELYKLGLRSIRWQRDNYLVGREYADERKVQRRRHHALPETLQPHWRDLIPISRPMFDPAALGNQQIARLGSWFIAGPVMHSFLQPIVVGLPTGPLRRPILNATVNLIPLSQENLDRVVKERLLWFFKDERMRELIKMSANGYIANTYRDSTISSAQSG